MIPETCESLNWLVIEKLGWDLKRWELFKAPGRKIFKLYLDQQCNINRSEYGRAILDQKIHNLSFSISRFCQFKTVIRKSPNKCMKFFIRQIINAFIFKKILIARTWIFKSRNISYFLKIIFHCLQYLIIHIHIRREINY